MCILVLNMTFRHSVLFTEYDNPGCVQSPATCRKEYQKQRSNKWRVCESSGSGNVTRQHHLRIHTHKESVISKRIMQVQLVRVASMLHIPSWEKREREERSVPEEGEHWSASRCRSVSVRTSCPESWNANTRKSPDILEERKLPAFVALRPTHAAAKQ